MRLNRLQGRKANDYLRREGIVWKGKTMTIRYLLKAPRNPNVDPAQKALYVGTAASTKLHKSAVKRNRMRRRCREALRTHVIDMPCTFTAQALIAPRIKSLTCSYDEIKDDIKAFIQVVSKG